MSGRVPALLVASVGVGVMVAVLAATGLAAQTRAPTGLRTTIETDQDDTRTRGLRQPKRPGAADPSPAGQIPSFGTPPGSGAGKTGFVSAKTKRKSKTGSQATTPPIAARCRSRRADRRPRPRRRSPPKRRRPGSSARRR